MKNQKPLNPKATDAALDIAEIADRQFSRALVLLDQALEDLGQRPVAADQAKAVRDAAAEMRKTITIVFEERKRCGTFKQSGSGTELDLDAARAEICERLARIQNAKGVGGVSEGVDA